MRMTQRLRSRATRTVLLFVCAIVAVHAHPRAAQVTATQILRRTLTVPADRPITIDATVAELQVTGWTRRDIEIEITLPRDADRSGFDMGIEDLPSALRIQALQLPGRIDRLLRPSIIVRAPGNSVFERIRLVDGPIVLEGLTGRVTASSRQGGIEGNHLAGVVRLETGFGNVMLRNAELVPDGLLRLRAFNGDVSVQLRRRPADARILAMTFNGRITSDIPLAMKASFGPKYGSASLGDGEPVLSIDVLKGSIGITLKR